MERIRTTTSSSIRVKPRFPPALGLLPTQTVVTTTEVIGRAHQIYPGHKRLLLMKQSPSASHQSMQTGTKGGVEALNIGTVQLLIWQRARFTLLCGSLHQSGLN